MRIRLPILALALLAATPARAQTPAPADTARDAWTDDALRRELLEMGRVDQEVREGMGAALQAQDTVFLRRMMRVDSVHAARMREILRAHGWPGSALVGREAAHAAWLLVQHGPLDLQREALPLIQAAGGVAPSELAMLTDRIRVREGKPQLYGSHADVVDGRLVPAPIENPERVHERRAAVGLPTLEEYVRLLEQMYGMPVDRSRLPLREP
jgi:hypothetical protein